MQKSLKLEGISIKKSLASLSQLYTKKIIKHQPNINITPMHLDHDLRPKLEQSMRKFKSMSEKC